MQRQECVLSFHVKKRGHDLATVQGEFSALPHKMNLLEEYIVNLEEQLEANAKA